MDQCLRICCFYHVTNACWRGYNFSHFTQTCRQDLLLILELLRIYRATTRAVYMTDDNTISKSIDLADFNHDNYFDIEICVDFGDNIEVFLNFGNRTFRNQKIHNMGSLSSSPHFVITGDVNNAHHPDIVVPLSGKDAIGILLAYRARAQKPDRLPIFRENLFFSFIVTK